MSYGFTHLGLLKNAIKHVQEKGWLATVRHLRMCDEVNFGYGKLVGVDR